MNHFPFHIGDWMRDTAHLSETEECIYARCIAQYYVREKPLPLDAAQCARLVRAVTAAARKALAVVLDEFFSKEADGWHQKRCDEEIALYAIRADLGRRNGLYGGRPRSDGQPTNNRQRNREITDHEPKQKANHKPVANNHIKARSKASTARVRATPLPADFVISERVRAWAADKGHSQLDVRLEDFVGKARAKGYVYADWDDAFMNAIRNDWANLAMQNNGKGQPAQSRRAAFAAEIFAPFKTQETHDDERDITGESRRVA